MLTRKAILSLSLKIVEVPTPEWGGSIFVREMNGAERLRFETEHTNAPVETFRERIAIATACDAKGDLLFKPEDAPTLAGKSFNAMHRISLAALEVNALTSKSVDVAEKN